MGKKPPLFNSKSLVRLSALLTKLLLESSGACHICENRFTYYYIYPSQFPFSSLAFYYVASWWGTELSELSTTTFLLGPFSPTDYEKVLLFCEGFAGQHWQRSSRQQRHYQGRLGLMHYWKRSFPLKKEPGGSAEQQRAAAA